MLTGRYRLLTIVFENRECEVREEFRCLYIVNMVASRCNVH